MSCNITPNAPIPCEKPRIHTLDSVGPGSMMKIYCACGRIVDLDIREMKIKLSLNKDIECTACRNARISRDIDCLNGFFNEGEITEGDSVSDIPA